MSNRLGRRRLKETIALQQAALVQAMESQRALQTKYRELLTWGTSPAEPVFPYLDRAMVLQVQDTRDADGRQRVRSVDVRVVLNTEVQHLIQSVRADSPLLNFQGCLWLLKDARVEHDRGLGDTIASVRLEGVKV